MLHMNKLNVNRQILNTDKKESVDLLEIGGFLFLFLS